MDIDASGSYSCEVSTDSPIFTKESQDHDLTVVQVQLEEPRIWFGKPRYQEGEWLQVNCTTGPAQPPPHVTWLINDQKVDEWKVKMYRGAEGVRTAQLGLEIGAEHVGELKLTCLSTIPAYLGHHARHSDYADSKQNTIAIEVIGKPRVPPRPEVRPSSSQSASGGQGGNQGGSSTGTGQSTGSKCRNQHASSKSSTSAAISPILIILVLLFTDIR